MKLYFSLVISSILFFSCNTITTPQPAIPIEGVYTNQSESEFSKCFDTISISPYNSSAATYFIIRKTGYFKINQDVLQPKQYKIEKSIGVFDEEHLQIQEQKKGIIYSVTTNGDTLLAGTARYIKLK